MRIFNILNYGSPDNIGSAVIKALADIKQCSEESELIFPVNTYHFYKEACEIRDILYYDGENNKNNAKHIAILLEDIENLTVDGCGSGFVFHGDITGIACIRCKNIVFKNFSMDYPCSGVIEMRTVETGNSYADFELSAQQQKRIKGLDVEFFEKSPYTDEIYWERKNASDSSAVYRIEPDTGIIEAVSDSPFAKNRIGIKQLSDSRIHFRYLAGKPSCIKDNCIFVLMPEKSKMSHGVFFSDSINITAENIRVFNLNGGAWCVQMCSFVAIRKCSFVPCAQRYLTGISSAIEVIGCKGLIAAEDCTFSNFMRNAISIHGCYMKVLKMLDSHTLRLACGNTSDAGIRQFSKGDKVVFYSVNTLLAAEEKSFTVLRATDPADSKDFMTSEVVFEEELPLCLKDGFMDNLGKEKISYVAENITCSCDITVSNCSFSELSEGGIDCTSGKRIDISSNSFARIHGEAIRVSPDAAQKYNAGVIRNMKISGNRFSDVKARQVIFINPVTASGKLPPWGRPVNRDVIIEGNEFSPGEAYCIFAKSTENFTIRNNNIKRSIPKNRDMSINAFRFEKCKNVMLENNKSDYPDDTQPEFRDMPLCTIFFADQ